MLKYQYEKLHERITHIGNVHRIYTTPFLIDPKEPM